MKRFIVKANRDESGSVYPEPLVKLETDNDEEAMTYCVDNGRFRHFITDTADSSRWYFAAGWVQPS